MIRAPAVNTVLNASRSVRQLLRRRNAFEEAIGVAGAPGASPASSTRLTSDASGAGARRELQAMELRDVSSSLLWLRACARTRRELTVALSKNDAAAVESHLTRFGALMKLGVVLSGLGAIRPSWLITLCQRRADKWYTDAVKDGLDKGVVVPGVTRGIHAHSLLRLRVEASTSELMEKEQAQTQSLDAAVQKAIAGSGHLNLSDEDLQGLTDTMKSVWGSSFGSWAVWRSAKYKVPIGRDAVMRILPFCQNSATRARVFEAYYSGFDDSVNVAALELLRTRRELAKRYGFKNWAEYQLRPLAVGSADAVHELLDKCWSDLQPNLSPALRRMDERASAVRGSSARPSRKGLLAHVSQEDEAFYRALVTREADTWKLAEFLPAGGTSGGALVRILDIVGRAYDVRFEEVLKPEAGRLACGWDKSVRIYEVYDGASPDGLGAGISSSARGGSRGIRGRLGFVYLDLYQRTGLFGRAGSLLAGAQLLCDGHAYLSMNMSAASYGHNKLLNPEEVVAITHELGHAVHMLCHEGSFQEFDDMPLDVIELPSTLAETIAMHPSAIAQYARHYASEGPPPDSLIRSCQRGAHFYVNYLQNANVALGLHGESFDPHSATPSELRQAAVSLWQRYSPVTAHSAFTPFGDEAGIYLGQGANHVAYLLCYLRVDAILHAQQRSTAAAASSGSRTKDMTQRWLSPEFAGRIRAQLLDRVFDGQRLALLLPPLGAGGDVKPPAHPLPPPPADAKALFGRTQQWASA